MNSRSRGYPTCVSAMILLTPSCFSFCTCSLIFATSSAMVILGPGVASSAVSLATAPTMPIFCPPTSSTMDGLTRSPIFEAAVATTLAVTTGNCTLSRKPARPSSLSSNS
ncbi:hypothetical protein D3C78_1144350 [compost metagenome]